MYLLFPDSRIYHLAVKAAKPEFGKPTPYKARCGAMGQGFEKGVRLPDGKARRPWAVLHRPRKRTLCPKCERLAGRVAGKLTQRQAQARAAEVALSFLESPYDLFASEPGEWREEKGFMYPPELTHDGKGKAYPRPAAAKVKTAWRRLIRELRGRASG